MEKHCVNLEIAKQLQEAGIEIETEFYWVEKLTQGKEWELVYRWQEFADHGLKFTELDLDEEPIPAPLLTELLTLAPAEIEMKGEIFFLELEKVGNKYGALYCNTDYRLDGTRMIFYRYGKIHAEISDTLQDALAKMLIHLKEQKLI